MKGKPIREQIGGMVRYYCSPECFGEELRRREKPLRKRLEGRPRRARRVEARAGGP